MWCQRSSSAQWFCAAVRSQCGGPLPTLSTCAVIHVHVGQHGHPELTNMCVVTEPASLPVSAVAAGAAALAARPASKPAQSAAPTAAAAGPLR